MEYNNLTYATISIDDLPKVDFKQVSQTSKETIKKSLDLTIFILSWNDEPEFIENGDVIPIGQYDHEEILELISTEDWRPDEN